MHCSGAFILRAIVRNGWPDKSCNSPSYQTWTTADAQRVGVQTSEPYTSQGNWFYEQYKEKEGIKNRDHQGG